jgi:hypothetical protein
MRNTSEGMVEIIGSAKIAPGSYSCETIAKIDNDFTRIRFGVNEIGYMFLKKIFSFQPFEKVTAGNYRYYFSGTYRQLGNEQVFASIRVEQGQRHKQFEMELTRPLVANLTWLGGIKSKDEVSQLVF